MPDLETREAGPEPRPRALGRRQVSDHDRRWHTQHPLCTCPELTWAMLDGRQPPPDRSQCRGGAIAHPPPLTAEQCQQLIANLSTGSAR